MVCHIFYAATVHHQTTFNTLVALLLASLAKVHGLLERQKQREKSQTSSQMHAQDTYNQPLYGKKIPLHTVVSY